MTVKIFILKFLFFKWSDLIKKCFLSDSMETQYIDLLNKRFSKLDLTKWYHNKVLLGE